MNLEDLYRDVDGFCRVFFPARPRWLPISGKRKRRQGGRLTFGEITTTLISFHQCRYRHFEACSLPHDRKRSPEPSSRNRFGTLIPAAAEPMRLDLHTRRKGRRQDRLRRCHIPVVCHNHRPHGHQVLEKIARRGKTSMSWFHGLVLHPVGNGIGSREGHEL